MSIISICRRVLKISCLELLVSGCSDYQAKERKFNLPWNMYVSIYYFSNVMGEGKKKREYGKIVAAFERFREGNTTAATACWIFPYFLSAACTS